MGLGVHTIECAEVSRFPGLRGHKDIPRMKVSKKVSARGWIFGAALALLPGLFAFGRHANTRGSSTEQSAAASGQKAPTGDALRLNTLGVAYLNQGKSADGQKYFEQALAADPEFALP